MYHSKILLVSTITLEKCFLVVLFLSYASNFLKKSNFGTNIFSLIAIKRSIFLASLNIISLCSRKIFFTFFQKPKKLNAKLSCNPCIAQLKQQNVRQCKREVSNTPFDSAALHTCCIFIVFFVWSNVKFNILL